MSELPPDSLESELRKESQGWTEGYLVRLYPDSRSGLAAQASEGGILAAHGYLTQSSELAREGSLMVAYVREDLAEEYGTLESPGLGAATDPDSFAGRFAKPLAWALAIAVIGVAVWLLTVTLTGGS